ncbi:MAG: Crp/Fnr family transcriptional regulator [Ginsengibacter sp.]
MKTSPVTTDTENVAKVLDFLDQIHPISLKAKKVLAKDCFPMKVDKKSFILRPGANPQYFYFIIKGVIQGYIKENGKNITTWIMQEGEIAGAFRAVGTGKPTDEYIQALEDCELVAIPISTTDYLYDHFPETNVIARRLWEFKYRQAEERAYMVRIPNASKKYNHFNQVYPGLVNRISLKYIATFLGMTLETLSRIRSQKPKKAIMPAGELTKV